MKILKKKTNELKSNQKFEIKNNTIEEKKVVPLNVNNIEEIEVVDLNINNIEEIKVDLDDEIKAIGIDDVMDSNEVVEEKPKASLKKHPKKSIQDCLVGTIEVGEDGETNFKVALNKAGRKFWKKV